MRMSESLMPATVASGMDATETDEALMLRYRDGDAEAFTVLYDRHKGACIARSTRSTK